MLKSCSIPSILLMLMSPALAHAGSHGHFDIMSVLIHIFEPDHVIFAILATSGAVIAYRAGRRAEARAIALRAISLKENTHDSR